MIEKQGKLVVISGPSGAGKTSVCRALKQNPDVEFSVSATTRSVREGEQDGIDYHFLTRTSNTSTFLQDFNRHRTLSHVETQRTSNGMK